MKRLTRAALMQIAAGSDARARTAAWREIERRDAERFAPLGTLPVRPSDLIGEPTLFAVDDGALFA